MCGRPGGLAAEPSYPEERTGPPTPASRRLFSAGDERGAPPAHLPAPRGRQIRAESLRGRCPTLLGGHARPLQGGERGCRALISGSFDQPAGEAGAGSAPRRREPGAGASRGRGCSPAGAPWPPSGMLRGPGGAGKRARPDRPGLLSVMTETTSLSGRKTLLR